jgi:hypothetical protein
MIEILYGKVYSDDLNKRGGSRMFDGTEGKE